MNRADANRLLVQAAEPTLERIRGECGRATGMVRKMLKHLPERLLDPDFDGAQWMRECGVSSSTTGIEFHALLGAPPGHYFRDAQMEVAARFLRVVDLSLEEIAGLFGYSRGDTFSDAFENWSGLRPIGYRKKSRKAIAAIGLPPDEYSSTPFLRKVIHGELEPQRAAELFDYLGKISTLPEGEGRRTRPAPAEAEIERLWAEELWARIRYKAFSEQQFILRQQLCFDTMAPFDLLREKCVEEGRLDRRLGVQLAELALDSLETCAGALGDDLPNRKAQGRIALANAYRLGGDHARAERSFSRAELDLAEAGVHRDPLVEAELHRSLAGNPRLDASVPG
ncbi:MAG: helix-turn-helix transcriptional regulator [bacterium]|nr:helix-turn-helix transcriptional regulator [bacterium]